jgi:uncharacterized repeat protein (TIGR01451 family)
MTTGSLKLISLLLVIAAGGGVAWQAQRGIQNPLLTAQSSADESTDDSPAGATDDESPEDLLADSEPEPQPEQPRPRQIAANWEENPRESADTAQLPQTIPSKFQRSPDPAKSLGAPIPVRTASLPSDDADEAEETSESDPFSNAEPTPIANDTRGKLPTLVPEPESADDEADPFEGSSSPVLLIGGKKESPPARRRATVAAEEADAEPTEDDPFAGAAPPDLDDAQPTELPPALEPLDFGSSPDDTDSSIAIPPNDAQEKPPSRTPKRSEPRRDSVDEVFGVDPSAEEPQPESGGSKSIELPADDFGAEPKSKATPIPSRRSSPRGTEPSAEKTPRLLPVPDNKNQDDFPPLPADLDGGAPPDLEEAAPKSPRGESSPHDLIGDGTPDQSAPKGLQQPRLTIEKIAPKQALLGQPLVYSVVVKNAGSADAHQVTVEDRIPRGTTLEGTSPRAEMVDKRLIWKLGTLKPDEQKKISIKVIPHEQGPIGSVAKVNFVAEITAEIEVTAPQILVSVDSPSQVRLGDKLHLVFKVRNAGRADAENIVIRNVIPEGLRHPAGADLEYALGKLPSQESREITLDLIATKNGSCVNKMVITGDGGIHVEEETPVEVVGEQLLLTRTGKNRLYVDKTAVFTSTIANEGTASAGKVMVAEIIPVGFEFVSASDNGRFDPSTRAVTWSVGPIAPGEELKVSTKLTPKHLGDHRATVTVTGPAGSVATVDAQLKVDGFPAVAVDSKSDTRLISIGEKAKIRISCKNQGTAAAKNVVLSAQLPPELRLVNGEGQTGWKQDGNLVTFEPLASLDPGEMVTFDVQVAGEQEGDTRIELQISADHLNRPLRRDETIRVAPEAE